MQELEKQFPEPALLPGGEEHRAEVEEVCQHASGGVTLMHCSLLQSMSTSLLRFAFGVHKQEQHPTAKLQVSACCDTWHSSDC